jgi:ribonucleoside-diphosphate reductase alpha chain
MMGERLGSWAESFSIKVRIRRNMVVGKIKKRDGRVVDFDRMKIRVAMEKASLAVDPNFDVRSLDMMTDHAMRHIEITFGGTIPDVESVQDLVERTLMEFGLFDIAKAYIIYRAERAKLRKEKEVEVVKPAKSFTVGTGAAKRTIQRKTLRNYFVEAAEGLDEIDVDVLTSFCEADLYEGMSEADFTTALVLAARSQIEKDPQYSAVASRLLMRKLEMEVLGKAKPSKVAYAKAFIGSLKTAVEQERLTPAMLEFDLKELSEYIEPDRDELLDYMGVQTLYDRYFLQHPGGKNRYELPQMFWMRVAMGVALNEGEQKNKRAKEFYDLISQLYYVPSTPTLLHAGTPFSQLSSCYLNTVDDELSHIFKVYGDNAQMSKYSGGIGTDWTNIRATGAQIKKINVGSQGLIPFLKIANDVTVSINRSGKRRGATAVYLENWHYDYEDYLDLRRNTGDERRRAHDINTASWIPDLFMKRVIDDKDWTLFSPEEVPELHHIYGKEFEKKYVEYEKKAANGEIALFKTIPAKMLWRKMITVLFETGHPWVTFKDACNVRSPQDHVGVIHNSNLCTEITLNTSADETAVCNLGSINLARHMKSGKLDLMLLKHSVTVAMRILDNVIDLNFYPTIEGKNSNMRHRPVGLGLMGFQDALYISDVDFDSDAAVKFADESMEFISYHAILASTELAKERGAYESFKGSKWDRGILPIDTLDLLEKERSRPIGVARTAKLKWEVVREAISKHGMRNSNCMAIAPTATISNISGCFPCIEPIYKNLYVKSNMSGESTIVNKYLVADLKKLGLWNQTMLNELKRQEGEVSEITTIPPRLRAKYKSVFEIDSEWLIKTAAYRGKWIDQSQSLNIFFRGSSGKRLGDLYKLAWHLGVKTTYYLRTLAASSIESSTLELNVTAAPMATATEESNIEQIAVPVGKACLINDPDCEACQ